MWPSRYRRRATSLTHITRKDLHRGMSYANYIWQTLLKISRERHWVIFKGKYTTLVSNFLAGHCQPGGNGKTYTKFWRTVNKRKYTQQSYPSEIKTSRTARSKEFIAIRLGLQTMLKGILCPEEEKGSHNHKNIRKCTITWESKYPKEK